MMAFEIEIEEETTWLCTEIIAFFKQHKGADFQK